MIRKIIIRAALPLVLLIAGAAKAHCQSVTTASGEWVLKTSIVIEDEVTTQTDILCSENQESVVVRDYMNTMLKEYDCSVEDIEMSGDLYEADIACRGALMTGGGESSMIVTKRAFSMSLKLEVVEDKEITMTQIAYRRGICPS